MNKKLKMIILLLVLISVSIGLGVMIGENILIYRMQHQNYIYENQVK